MSLLSKFFDKFNNERYHYCFNVLKKIKAQNKGKKRKHVYGLPFLLPTSVKKHTCTNENLVTLFFF